MMFVVIVQAVCHTFNGLPETMVLYLVNLLHGDLLSQVAQWLHYFLLLA